MPQLKALGGLRLEPSLFTQPKPLLLLSYLSLEGAQVRRHLAELFWGDGNRMKSLSMTFTRLRQGAGEIVAADNKRAWTTLTSDVKELLAALDKSDWKKATELYTGAFVEGVVLDDWSSELEEWVYTTREYLAERVQYALLNLAEDAAKAGDFLAATHYAERAYTLPGLAGHEVTTLKRLYTLLCAGSSALAPDVRKEAESYGLSLTLTTEAARVLFESVSTTRTRALPMRGTSFVGRDLELTELASLLARPACQLVTVLGVAGLGKTRLAVQFAFEQQALGVYADGVYFVALESLTKSSDFLGYLAQQLGVKQGEQEPLEQLEELLQNKHALLILDNFEHLIDAAPQFSNLLQRCPNVKTLVTSRERLNLEEEHSLTLSGLRFPQTLSGEDVSTFDALQLFEQRAKQLSTDFELTPELSHVISICQLVEGSPLGIELAAGWIRLMPCAEIAGEIGKNLDFLASTTRNTPDRHRSIRATFEYSWRLLSAQEQEVFSKLAVFRGGFRREAASEVAGATIPLLASFVDKSLLRVLPNGRYDQHPLIYQYAREKLQERSSMKGIEARHLSYYLNLVQAQEEAVQSGRQEDALRVFHEEWQNCQVIPESILESGDEAMVLRWVELVDSYYDVRGAYTEALAFLTRAEEVVKDNAPLLGRVLLEKGYALLWLGEAHPARENVLQGLTLIPETQKRWRARGLNSLGFASNVLGEFDRALTEWQEALALARETNYTIYEAHITGNLGINETERGNFLAAESYHKESLRLYQELGAINGYSREHLYLALTYYMMGELVKAKTAAEEGLKLAKTIDYTLFIPYALGTLGLIEATLGNLEAALSHNREALRLNRETDDKDTQAKLLRGLALVESALGHLDVAATYAEEALGLARQIASDSSLAGALLVRGELFTKHHRYDTAAKILSLVARHPATLSYERKLAEECMVELEAHLSYSALKAARAFAEAATLETVLTLAVESERDVLKSR